MSEEETTSKETQKENPQRKTDRMKDPPTDYAGAQKKQDGPVSDKPAIKPVVDAKVVVVKKRGIGSKIKDLFIAADFRSVMQFVGQEVLLPAARGMIVDSVQRGVERLTYGEARSRRTGPGASRVTYNQPVQREWREPRTRPPDRTRFPRAGRRDIFLPSREEATLVLDEMFDILGTYEVVTVAQMNELMGLPSSHVDNKWGWYDLRGSEVRPAREGFYIDLPQEEPIER